MACVFYFLSSTFMLTMSLLLCSAAAEDRKVHIVYMGSLPQGKYSPLSHHLSILQEVLDKNTVANSLIIRSYKRSFNGFAALLTNQEAQKLASKKEIVSVFPSTNYKLLTTRSWDFMNFKEPINRKPSNNNTDVILGVLDSGIWPESKSFNDIDKGFGPPPKKWKGVCEGGRDFICNNKLIGARDYTGNVSARDHVGHGSHTASTAAGSIVEDASFYGIAKGTARGGIPSARIAVYKVCDELCGTEAILSAFDDAIADGVDIITISIGPFSATKFEYDVIAIGAFHSMEKGVLTVQAAGNEGAVPASITSVAPWLLSVGASTIDRRIIDKVLLGNGKTIIGYSINSFTLNESYYPLAYGKDVSDNCSDIEKMDCSCIDSKLAKGKIVLCGAVDGMAEAYYKGAVGAITLVPKNRSAVSFIEPFPVAQIIEVDVAAVASYIDSTKHPKANILKSETIKDPSAPLVIYFSSRGPNPIVSDIMKPDVVAPGVDILAAYSPVAPLATVGEDQRRVNYSFLIGTSMACPHVAAVAAYVKTIHPDWSPSAIKSAIMTTALEMDPRKNEGGEFAYGSGHLNPNKATDPGLVYETYKEDYITMLCGLGYKTDLLRNITGDNSTCSDKGSEKALAVDLNYPSMTAHVTANEPFNVTFHRTVTNVGLPNSTYKVELISSSTVDVKVVPQVLSFESVNEEKTFEVNLVGNALFTEFESASLVWSDGTHRVRSPIVVYS